MQTARTKGDHNKTRTDGSDFFVDLNTTARGWRVPYHNISHTVSVAISFNRNTSQDSQIKSGMFRKVSSSDHW